MKTTITLLSLTAAFGLSSCGITSLIDSGGSAVGRIERGMSRDQVLNILGRPDSRSFGYNGEEIWEYQREALFDQPRTIRITFYEGRVVKLDNYRTNDRERRETYPNYPSYPPQRGEYPSYPPQRGDYPSYPNYPGYPGYDPSRYRLSEEAFQRILYGAQRQPFTDDKLRYLRDAAQRNRFTVSQAERLLRLFTWDEEKLKVLGYVANGLLDPQEAYRLVDLFTFDTGKRKARRILGYR